MIKVSSAYRRWLTRDSELGIMTPRSFLVDSVSERVAITVSKIRTLNGSPWYTPISRGMDGDIQSEVEIDAERPSYQNRSRLQKPVGTW